MLCFHSASRREARGKPRASRLLADLIITNRKPYVHLAMRQEKGQ